MRWISISINTTQEAVEAVSEMLMSLGAGGVEIHDPKDLLDILKRPNNVDYVDKEFIESLGCNVTVKAYFPADINLLELDAIIKEKLEVISTYLDVGKGYEGYSELDEEDWSTAWKKYYKPLHISNRLVIKPTWESYEPKDEEIVVEMDPGMAFGTGTHETTRMCTEFLEKYIKEKDKVIDVGCGTGILAITASKLGASDITALDIDNVAVNVTKQNIELNNTYNIKTFTGALNDVETGNYDVMVANIIASVIIGISTEVSRYLKPGGLIIASGIIKEKRQNVYNAYIKAGFNLIDEKCMGEWVAMVFKCPDIL